MIDAKELLTDCRRVADLLVDDLRARTDDHEESRESARLVYAQAQMAGRTDKTWEEWREDLLAQVASGWVLAAVFVRFCEDNRLVDDPLLSGPGDRGQIARDHRAEFFAANPQAGDREWLQEVFGRYRKLPAVSEVFGGRNPLWQLAPSADGARELLELWWATDEGGTRLRHDFTDLDSGTRFLGDLYQDLSEHARKQYALLQTPDFVEEFILDRTLDPAIAEFGLEGFKMIDPTCGSGHFLLGAFNRLTEAWRTAEPNTSQRELAQRALDSVHGVDINPFAVAIARFRLLLAALKVSGELRLENLPGFRLNLAVGDSLLHGSHGGMLFPPEDIKSALAHHYPTEDADAANQILAADAYHAVVGNPPYITASDPASNTAYRALYPSCHGQYSLAVPFAERFFDLAVPATSDRSAGYVGKITANSFMKAKFGRPLVETFLTSVDLTLIVDSSVAYLPGHKTGTVILFGRSRAPVGDEVSVVLGVERETEADSTPSAAWLAIIEGSSTAGFASRWVTSRRAPRSWFASHPWSLEGGVALELKVRIDAHRPTIRGFVQESGARLLSRLDDFFEVDPGVGHRWGLDERESRAYGTGDKVRDWRVGVDREILFPYDENLNPRVSSRFLMVAWPYRTLLSKRVAFGKTQLEHGLPWYALSMLFPHRFQDGSLVFSDMTSHNHFALVDGVTALNSHAPVLVPTSADSGRRLVATLNSSVACFWMKQTFQVKGTATASSGIPDQPWSWNWEFSVGKLLDHPSPDGVAIDLAQQLVGLAGEIAIVERRIRSGESAALLNAEQLEEVRCRRLREMVVLQEELDWRTYRAFGLTDQDCVASADVLERIRQRGLESEERPFAVALAQSIANGDAATRWFEYHGREPRATFPDDLDSDARALFLRRIEARRSDESLSLLESPEFKRRWMTQPFEDLLTEGRQSLLLGTVERILSQDEVALTTVARLADRLAQDPDAVHVARDLAGASVDLVDLVGELVAECAVPFLAAWRYTDSGIVKRRAWERTWDLQRNEDQLDARTQLPEDDPNHLDESGLKLARKEAGIEKIPVPPKYATKDFRDTVTYKMRGKLDVPKERFISYPGTKAGADTTAVIGWAGWDHLQQARALAAHYNTRRSDGAETEELVPLLAGLAELVPWLKQWHNEPDPTFGERMGDFFAGFVDSEAAAVGVTAKGLTDWRPPAKTRRRRKKKASS